ncbi:hypothetical protein FRC12_001883 [Ceratobasidium sp. 428]|nr:hypothetical protein FRC12_001883 [Ceratobasidium sp. 428]
MNHTCKKKFSISAGLRAAGLVPVVEKNTSPLFKSMYHCFASDDDSSPPTLDDRACLPSDLEGIKSPRSGIYGFLSARLGRRQLNTGVGRLSRFNTSKRRAGDFPGGGAAYRSRNIMELVHDPHSPESCSRSDSLSLMQATISEAHYSRSSQIEHRISASTASTYATAKETFITTPTLPLIGLSQSCVDTTNPPKRTRCGTKFNDSYRTIDIDESYTTSTDKYEIRSQQDWVMVDWTGTLVT